MADLSTPKARSKLPTRSAPHNHKIAPGQFLGYRRQTDGKAGLWVLRSARDEGGYSQETLAVADDMTPADGREIMDYAQAMARAIGQTTADPSQISVEAALDDWAEWKCRTASSEKQCTQLRNTARRLSRAFPRRTLKTINVRNITAWMNGMVEGAENPQARRSTANRELAALKAALTRSADLNSYRGERAWERVSKFTKAESFGRRMVILTEAEENRVIEAARPDFANVLRALQLTGARYGEIASATVGDLNGKRLSLTGKTGRRVIVLSDDKAAFFRRMAGNRTPSEPLLQRQDGKAWADGAQMALMCRAVAAAGVDDAATTYCFRHGFITRALTARIPTVAVAQFTGTSVQMIEATYAQFAASALEEWFA